MMRIDRYLAEAGCGTRSEVKKKIRLGLVTVDGQQVGSADQKIDETKAQVCLGTEEVRLERELWYMLHKPAGVVTATWDRACGTVMELLGEKRRRDLFPVGRLDKDTEGLLLITNNGQLAHELLSPSRHVDKTYQVLTTGRLGARETELFARGVNIGERKACQPALLEVLPAGAFPVPGTIQTEGEVSFALVTIREGRYHQIKRMFEAADRRVLYLRRVAMAGLSLDPKLEQGGFRALTKEETRRLKNAVEKGQSPERGAVLAGSRITDLADALLFDMDGTLMDSMWMWKDIDVEYLGRFGLTVPGGLQKEIEGMGFTETAEYFKRRFHLSDTVEQIKRDWNDMAREIYAHQVRPKPGAVRFLRRMRAEGKKMAVTTSNSRDLALSCLNGCGLTDCFDLIITACEVDRGKPSPDIYLAASQRLGVRADRCLVFEDVPMGILAGKKAQMRVCAMADDYSRDQTARIRELADYYIEDYEQVLSCTHEVLR